MRRENWRLHSALLTHERERSKARSPPLSLVLGCTIPRRHWTWTANAALLCALAPTKSPSSSLPALQPQLWPSHGGQAIGQAIGTLDFDQRGLRFRKYMTFLATLILVIGLKVPYFLDQTQGVKVNPPTVCVVVKKLRKAEHRV